MNIRFVQLTVSLLYFLIYIPLTLFPLTADVDYTEGEAIIHEKLGEEYDVQIGDTVETGDNIKTGSDGYVELLQGNAIVKISAESIFTLLEKAEGQTKRGVEKGMLST